ncbi:MAG: hypothetical protein KDA87_12570, partial [Planctomycetales bacterium]|nr:hypothetical protein [Planctomycetales bacterium]
MDNSALWISLVVFFPTVVALLLAFVPKGSDDLIKLITLVATIVTFGGVVGVMMLPFDIEVAGLQNAFSLPWITSFDIDYFMAVDGISLPLLVLTGFVSIMAMIAAWSITKNVKAFCILFLVLETGMLGVFLALDFFLFYVFWEVMLLPMYFLIGVWGGPRKEYAAIKFFLYTLFGSVLMLIAILMLYFNSDLVALQQQGVDLTQFQIRESVVAEVQEAATA